MARLPAELQRLSLPALQRCESLRSILHLLLLLLRPTLQLWMRQLLQMQLLVPPQRHQSPPRGVGRNRLPSPVRLLREATPNTASLPHCRAMDLLA